MRGVVWSFVGAALGGGVAAAFVAFFLPVDPSLVVDIYLLYLGGLVLLALVRSIRIAQPGAGRSPFEEALTPIRAGVQRPRELVQLEQRLALATTSAFDVHFRLRPVIRDIAAQQLWETHGVDLDGDPPRAESLLDGEVWDLARPDRPAPADAFAPGIQVRDLERIVERLEQA